MLQVISIAGSLIILAAYGANQFGLLPSATLLYSVLNLIGSAILAAIALIEHQWGFLLLEGVWALISLWTTFALLTGAKAGGAPGPR